MKTMRVTVAEIAERFGCKKVAAYGFVQVLVALGLARKIGHSPQLYDRGRLKTVWEIPETVKLKLGPSSKQRATSAAAADSI